MKMDESLEVAAADTKSDDFQQRSRASLEKLQRFADDPRFAEVAADLKEVIACQMALDSQSKELARAAEELSDARQLYFEHFRQAPVPILRVDRDGSVVEMNLAASEILHHPTNLRAGARTEWIERLLPSDSIPFWKNFLKEIFIGKEKRSCEISLKNPDDSRSFFVVTGRPAEGGYAVLFFQDITQQHEREEELSILRTAVEQSPSTIVITDLTGAIQYVNPAFEKTSGYSRDEVIGQNPRLLKSSRQSPGFYREMWKTLMAGQTWRGNFHNRTKDGASFWELAAVAPLRDSRGNLSGYIAIKQDVTAQKVAEEEREALLDSLRKTQLLLEQTNALAWVGGWEVDLEKGTIFHSSITRRIHEISETEEMTLEKAISFYKEGDSRNRIRSAVENAIATGEPFDLELEFITARGNPRWIRAVGLGEFLDGKCRRLFGAFQDITSQRELLQRYENALTDERRRLRYIQDLTASVPVAIFTKDLDGKFLDCNSAYTSLTGFTREEIVGTHLDQINNEEGRREIQEENERLIRQGHGTIHTEKKTWHKDGREIFVIVTKGLLHDENDRVVGIVGALVDITENRKMEEDLRNAKLAAEAANRAKSAFLATMSHEIRTPLNAVIGMASLLQETPMAPQQRDYVHTISSASESLLDLISDILDYSKIESHKLELHCEPFIFEDLFLEPVELFSRPAAAKGIELTHLIDPALPRVFLGDRIRIKQILINLLSNALKFTSRGEISIEASSLGKEGDRWKLQFLVRDTGVGIPEEALSRIFHPFSQADSSVTREFGGTGLGLAICRRLVDLMGGEISVRSKPGTGSEFVFRITLPEARLPDPDNIDISLFQGRTLLVVDDVFFNRQLLSAFGRQWGMEVLEAEGASAALQILQGAKKIDAAIIDYQMPNCDGVSLANQIRELPESRDLFRILLSSIYEPDEEIPKGIFHAVLHKPLRPSRLKEILSGLFQSADGEQAMLDASGDLSNLRVLVAEDNANNRTVLKLMLKRSGCHIVLVENGALALEADENQVFDAVILDVQMPVMDGLTAASRLREKYREAPIRPSLLALTANAFVEDEKACMEAGFDQYLAKPITYSQLRNALAKTLP